jgi:SAM-dependent methyltransferase
MNETGWRCGEGGGTVVFEWRAEDFEALLGSCDRDDGVQLSLRVIPKEGRILEAGCGTGRVVKFFHDRGYAIEGVELNGEIVAEVKRKHPDLKLLVGDVSKLGVPDDHYNGLLSYGVIEHFVAGPEAVLKEHFRVLAPDGIAVITAPSYNGLRRIKHAHDVVFCRFNPRMNNVVRRLLGHKPMRRNVRGRDGFRYHVFPQFLGFFEYRLRPREFEEAVCAAGFKILESLPISHMDGMYHEFGRRLVRFEKWRFFPTPAAIRLNGWLKRIPFFHNHMHAIVATK